MRRAYEGRQLEESELESTWLAQLARWLEEAVNAGSPEPNAMVLATASREGAPSARTVLLKGLDERGLAFYTNLNSRKGRELAANPRAALVFPWLSLQRQVVVEGRVEALASEESDAYFASRPYGAQLAALASPQSQRLDSREQIDRAYADLSERHPEGQEVPRPHWWGGRRVVPESVEFWQGRPNRLHDRLRYRRTDSGAWVIERLAP